MGWSIFGSKSNQERNFDSSISYATRLLRRYSLFVFLIIIIADRNLNN